MFSFNQAEFGSLDQGIYAIGEYVDSYASRIFFIHDNKVQQDFCVKMWRLRADSLYQTMNQQVRTEYLVEGLYFNRQCAPEVYLGIAPIQVILKDEADENSAIEIQLGKLLAEPHLSDLEEGKEYALVMVRLDNKCQLSNMLQDTFATKESMEFLAYEIYRMHQQPMDVQELEKSCKIGSVTTLAWKLALNKNLFLEAVASLSLPDEEVERCNNITGIMDDAYMKLSSDFVERVEQKQIRRCHGDLKATNLWVYTANESTIDAQKNKRQLLALDCIDFKPEFCHIDTLSDIAMLAIDIELFVTGVMDKESGKALAKHFLATYLEYAHEQQNKVWPLLDYYMVEKAMVGTYGNILFDRQLEQGKCYILLALDHAQNLRASGT